MPTYTYQCGACAHRFDAVQSIHDDALTACPECAGTLRKVFGTVGVTFKGSGFYRTDSRAANRSRSTSGSSARNGSSSSGSSGSDSSGTSSSSGDKAPKPAAAPSSGASSSS